MRILFLAPYSPSPPIFGGATRIYHLMRQVARRHEVHLAAFFEGWHLEKRYLDALDSFCASVTRVDLGDGRHAGKRWAQAASLLSPEPYQRRFFYSPALQDAVDRVVSRVPFDLITVEFSQMAYYRLPPGVPAILDEHNVEHELIRRSSRGSFPTPRGLFNVIESAKFRRDERRLCEAFSHVLTTSEEDMRALRALGVSRPITVISNGVDCDAFAARPREPGPPTVLFTGAMHYYPNAEGVRFFMEEIHPLVVRRVPDLRVFVVGGTPPPDVKAYERIPGVVVTGFVDDVRAYFSKADVFVVPLRIGGGTRLKILEAMSSGFPVVSTTVGCEGIAAERGKEIVVADDPVAFADAVAALLGDPVRRAAIGAAARARAQSTYDWNVVAERLERVYTLL